MITSALLLLIGLILIYIPQIQEQWYLYGKVIGKLGSADVYYDEDFSLHIDEGNWHEVNLAGPTTKWVIKKLKKNGLDIEMRTADY